MNKQENEAMQRAEAWVKIDPLYVEKALNPRERRLMALAIRAVTSPAQFSQVPGNA